MTAKKTPSRSRSTRTRADVEESFNQIRESRDNAEQLDPQAAQLAQEHAAKTRKDVALLDVNSIVQKSAALGLELNRSLSAITEQCVAKVNELATLTDAVNLETKELERLYSLDVASAAIQLLIADHDEKKTALEKEISEARAAWNEEYRLHQKTNAQRDSDLQMSRQREESEYNYNKKMERAKADDVFTQKSLQQEREFALKTASFERDLSERKAAIAKEEADIIELRARVAGFEEEIKKSVNSAVAVATSSLKKDLLHEFAIKENGLQTQIQLASQKNEALTVANTELAKQVLALQAQVEAAKTQAQDIAIKALESASGQQALAQVTSIVRDSGGGTTGRNNKS